MKSVVSIEVFHSAFGNGFRRVAEISPRADGIAMGAELSEAHLLEVDRWLEFAYELTNTYNAPWWENPRVTEVDSGVLFNGGARSTSVDDYMRVWFDDESEAWFVVANVGFEAISDGDMVKYAGYEYNAAGEATRRVMEEMTFAELRSSKAGVLPPHILPVE